MQPYSFTWLECRQAFVRAARATEGIAFVALHKALETTLGIQKGKFSYIAARTCLLQELLWRHLNSLGLGSTSFLLRATV